MLYTTKPKNFNLKFTVVSCFVQYQDQILLLHRQDYKPEGNTWGVPAGKLNGEESLEEALRREIREETGIVEDKLVISHFKKVYVSYEDYDFVYHIFVSRLDRKPKIRVNNKEHKGYKWVEPTDALRMNLIEDLDSCINMYYK